MKLLNNLVAIKTFPSDEIRLNDGKKLYLDIRFEEYLNARTAGEVVAVPQKLKFDPSLPTSLDWDTDMELQVGDVVVFNYLAVKSAIEMGNVFGDGVVAISYDKIYTAIRNGQVVCVNGFILVEPEQEHVASTLHLPDIAMHKSKQIGTVVYAGTPNRGYRVEKILAGHTAPDRAVSVGDRVVFNWNDAIPIQPNAELRGEITRGLLYRMQHKDVHAVVSKESLVIA